MNQLDSFGTVLMNPSSVAKIADAHAINSLLRLISTKSVANNAIIMVNILTVLSSIFV